MKFWDSSLRLPCADIGRALEAGVVDLVLAVLAPLIPVLAVLEPVLAELDPVFTIAETGLILNCLF